MTVTLALLRDTDPAAYAEAADAWGRLAEAMDDRLDEFVADSRDLSTVWPTGTEAERRAAALRVEIANTHEPCRRISQALRAHGDAVWQLQGMLGAIVAECAGNGLTVDLFTATVSAVPGSVTDTAQAARMPGLVQGYNEQLRDLAARAVQLDEQTRAAVRAGMHGTGGPGAGPEFATCTPLDEVTGKSPAEVYDWWRSLSRAQQDQLIRDFPERIGWLDGVPAADRDEANRTALDNRKQQVLQQLQQPTLERDALEKELRNIHKVEEALNRLGDKGFLLGVDAGAYDGHGKLAIAVGNPDTARHAGVWVPGLDSTLYGDMDTNLDRMIQMNREADRLTGGRGGDVSTVYWLGYDAPDLDNPSVLSEDRSVAGRDPYLNFMNGLRATHEGDPAHLVAMGHSYGSTVVGEAARTGGLPVDDIVVAGSPGMHVDDASQLHGDSRHVWAGASSTDPVADAKFLAPWDKIMVGAASPVAGVALWGAETAADGTHGDAPTSPGFGANNWVADTGGHTSYWNQGSDSLKNQARILAGMYSQTTLNSGERPEDIR
ncbi:hypothetical protein FHR83_008016 [Actinoplanes campanulatus]|uniref:DUF1023 domain-containing protein n=1 Tax=Actinoplanes campanulatus TaxID=113559 RepID=A0A7W5AR37_9ACTN|nr:alpha/beta hydrolase [Actinoplanes campanulatus]MBB3100294.1 hypothetical protein [Actinoplanes campanulatus]GGN44020.1 hypothetical protein GCM10010109_76760 [Actinoplanes campanulatus]GID40904.1 hypothetical protein Aca09nite_74100 [Actinoplanes campanulatus]